MDLTNEAKTKEERDKIDQTNVARNRDRAADSLTNIQDTEDFTSFSRGSSFGKLFPWKLDLAAALGTLAAGREGAPLTPTRLELDGPEHERLPHAVLKAANRAG